MKTHDKRIFEYTDEELVQAVEDPASETEEVGAQAEITTRFIERHVA